MSFGRRSIRNNSFTMSLWKWVELRIGSSRESFHQSPGPTYSTSPVSCQLPAHQIFKTGQTFAICAPPIHRYRQFHRRGLRLVCCWSCCHCLLPTPPLPKTGHSFAGQIVQEFPGRNSPCLLVFRRPKEFAGRRRLVTASAAPSSLPAAFSSAR